MVMLLLPVAVHAQRLCENSDSSVAKISPCTGPTGTTISVILQRKLKSPPATLLFKRVLANGVPAQVGTPISGLSASAPPQLCVTGNGKWDVWLIDASGESQGVIGAYWSDCSSTTPPSSGSTGPATSSSGAAQRLCENSDSAVATISPCTGPAGTTINVALRRRLASPPKTLLFKRILTNGVPAQVRANVSGLTALTTAQLCTTGGGRWEVWLIDAAGKSQGVIGAFWPYCSGATGPPAGGGGGAGGGGPKPGPNNPAKPKPPSGGSGAIDACLIGTWEATSIIQLSKAGGGATGGAGFRVIFKLDGTETIDYFAMKPIVFNDSTPAVPDTFTYKGAASGHIATEKKIARIESIEKAGVTNDVATAGRNFRMKLPGLGPGGLGSTANNNSYTCTENSLEYQTSVSVDRHPDSSVKLMRRKGPL